MKCDRTQKVSLLIDGELPRAEAQELERHLDLCDDCQSAREDFLLLRRQLADYPLELDAFARQRALKRILAAGANGATGLEHERAGATPPRRRRESAGVFGMPRLSPAALAALLLLAFGVALGVVSLTSSRRAPVDVASNEPMPAPAANSNQGSPAPTPNAQIQATDDLTASATKANNGERKADANEQRRAAGEELPERASVNAARGARANVNRRRAEESAGARVLQASPPTTTPTLNLNRRQVAAPVAEVAGNDVEAVDGITGTAGGDDAAARRTTESASAAGESKTARHFEQAQLLLRSFRNARPADAGRRASSDLAYEKQRSRRLLYENIVLRREAASRGNLPVESLLDSLEPILIDIANLPERPAPSDVREINERMRRKNLVAMLQISVVESASARSY
ncbi:MAG TPA: zf-HC2 domain-containing protein [Pyrinomonadaceae bacterium]|nr:zf-HC2 domain-containing protein [Pyrinomonadaceae bacterium]